jgi:hypothetical protein
MWRMISSTRDFAEKYRHNLERVAIVSIKRSQRVAEIQMPDEVAFSETGPQAC